MEPVARIHVGAQGLMQLMPSVADELGVLDPFNPRENILASTLYLKQLLDRFHGNVRLAIASYNAGPGSVERFRGVPPYPETRRYVKEVERRFARGRADS